MLLVNALAGTGKTTTICWGLGVKVPTGITISKEQLEIVKFMRSFKWDSCAAMAFNRSIADELVKRLDHIPGVECTTSNGFGFRNWKSYRDPVKVNLNGNKLFMQLKSKLEKDKVPYKEYGAWMNDVIQVVRSIKYNVTDFSAYETIVDDNDIILDVKAKEYCEWLYNESINSLDFIDFDDQLFMPYHYDVPINQYDLVVVDECVPGWTPVMMDDGSSLPIEDIKVGMVVRSYDTNTKIGKDCKVTATQKLLNQKPLVKIKVQHLHLTGTNKKTNFVICTVDHKVWTTNRGWVPAGEITTNDVVIIETEAQTTQKGKITGDGRKVLSDSKLGNTLGLGNIGGNADQFNSIKGGNGRELSLAHRVLLEALGGNYVSEFVIKTRNIVQGEGYANHYKIDIADPERKIAIEIDGGSHSNPVIKAKDAKKQELLEIAGWKVFRYTNQEAIQNTANIVCKLNGGNNCPKPAKVISVDSVTIRDNYVYDITVEDCHNFYANGILVHNCQDLNKAKQWLAQKMARKYMVCIGDVNQAIYGFSGADSASMDTMGKYMSETWKESFETMSLTVTRRCPKTVVTMANKFVPTLKAADEAPDGQVLRTPEEEFGTKLVERTNKCMILCRTNAPLMSLAFYLLRNNRPCYIQGKDIGSGLVKLLNSCAGSSIKEKLIDLDNVVNKKCLKYEEKGQNDKAELLRDKALCIRTIADNVESIDQFKDKINLLFKDSGGLTEHQLSSVHKSKGLEANWVCIYKPSTLPLILKPRKGKKIPKGAQQQEYNLAYVAVTRSQNILEYVIEPKKKSGDKE
jgi:very-short-patch-repair endonuclease